MVAVPGALKYEGRRYYMISIKGSEKEQNLLKAFAGESQARTVSCTNPNLKGKESRDE
jgi:hypothetical protein